MPETPKPIVVVGSVTMDMVTLTPQIPSIGQTVIGTGFTTTPGGKGANQAVAAARLGYPVHMVGKVGDDAYGPALLQNLAAAGVNTAAMETAPAAELPKEVWSQVAWFTPNETEAEFYLDGSLTPEVDSGRLLCRGPKGVVLKRGAEGSYVARDDGKSAWVYPFPVAAIDTVGAGDCFNGAFAVALLEGNHPWAAAHIASIAAAISVTRRGAQASMPTRADIKDFLAKNK